MANEESPAARYFEAMRAALDGLECFCATPIRRCTSMI